MRWQLVCARSLIEVRVLRGPQFRFRTCRLLPSSGQSAYILPLPTRNSSGAKFASIINLSVLAAMVNLAKHCTAVIDLISISS